jgi:hypothetical protein
VVLDRLLAAWLEEADLTLGVGAVGAPDRVPHQWFWPGREPADPRVAGADDTRMRAGLLSIPAYYARQGRDFEIEQRNQARALGLTLEEYRARLAANLLGEAGDRGPAGAPDRAKDRNQSDRQEIDLEEAD